MLRRPTLSLPAWVVASFWMTGRLAREPGFQVAQNSTRVGKEAWSTSTAKLSSSNTSTGELGMAHYRERGGGEQVDRGWRKRQVGPRVREPGPRCPLARARRGGGARRDRAGPLSSGARRSYGRGR